MKCAREIICAISINYLRNESHNYYLEFSFACIGTIKITDDISQSIYISSHNGSAMINNAKETREGTGVSNSFYFLITIQIILNYYYIMCSFCR